MSAMMPGFMGRIGIKDACGRDPVARDHALQHVLENHLPFLASRNLLIERKCAPKGRRLDCQVVVVVLLA